MSSEFFFLFAGLGLFGSAVGGYYDLKTSEIPDEVPLSISIIGLLLYFIDFLFYGNAFPFISIMTICGFFLITGYILFWLSQWGEADVLILGALGVLLPYLFSVQNNFADAFFFANVFLIASFAVGGIYSIVFSIAVMFRDKKVKDFAGYILKEKKQVRVIVLIIIAGVSLYIYARAVELYFIKILAIEFLIFVPMFYFLIKFAKFIDEFVYRKKIKTSDLVEGDVIAQEIDKLNIKGTRYEGIMDEDIKKIQKVLKYVYVKDGVRYAPVFFFTILFFMLFWNKLAVFI
ncbi:MAG: prepilin peptidase [Candidatus Aenigmarchaeota archaeon]|nr:prepilin peptidase [Candidatus Aenigmarchaeota archaeon]